MTDIQGLVGDEAKDPLTHTAQGILQSLFDHGRLAGTGYVSILPVDQGTEHSAASAFARTPATSTRRTSSNSPSRAAATPKENNGGYRALGFGRTDPLVYGTLTTKAFQRPTAEGVELLHAVQDVYLDDSVTVA
ncbi:beta/alpha barrel domain-containing protein [Streptomyces ferrugineus]|uniref:hypothetical protein n=1 Tax=Streptomyces ferrugineus TaxID=1413221 RepID=UPI001D156324|nr:hypothetical protein [Streptomyces ferrugineus]